MDLSATGIAVSTVSAALMALVAILGFRRQVRRDAAAAQKAIMAEVRRIGDDIEGRHNASASAFDAAIRTIHERIDRKEKDSRAGDERLERRLDAMQGTMAQLLEIKGEVKAIRTQITVIQHGLQEKK